MGIGANDRLNLRNSDTLSRLIQAMAVQEVGRGLDAGTVSRGVGMALGAPPVAGPYAGGAGSGGANGRVQVDLTVRDGRGNITATTRTEGDVSASPPRVVRAMPGGSAP